MRHKIFGVLAILALGWMGGACSSEELHEPSGGVDGDGVPTLAISIGVAGATRADDDPAEPDFELGTGLENFLNIAGDDYRIYFFDTDNKYLATFIPTLKPSPSDPDKPINPGNTNNTDGETTYYHFWGKVPDAVTATKFKLVFLANWKNYPEEAESAADGEYKLVKEKTTIADIVTNTSAQFTHLNPGENEPWLSQSDRLIPFYGVRAYDVADYVESSDIVDGKIKGDIFIDLSKKPNSTEDTSIPLIRAMAKVEVILNNPFASFSKVEMTKVNRKGFCAPYGNTNWKFDYNDYFFENKYDWEKNFTRELHLVGGQNDESSSDAPGFPFKKVSSYQTDNDGNVTSYEKWVAYVPEFQNIGVGTAFTAITVTLAEPDYDDTTSGSGTDGSGTGTEGTTKPEWEYPEKTIYFAPNGSEANNEDGAVGTTKRYNIERNNIYRFTITGMTTNLNCQVDVQPYANIIVDPFYGLDRDEDGNIIVERHPDGTYEILDNGKYITKDPDGDVIKKRFKDGSLLCEETIYKDYIHDDSEVDYVYVFEKDAPGGNMIILREKTTGGIYHGEEVPDGEEHEHDTDDKALFILDKKGDFYYVHYDENGKVKELTRTDKKGDTIIQANGYQFRRLNEMAKYLGTYIVLLQDGSEELRHWQTGEAVDWDTGIGTTRSNKKHLKFQWMKDLNDKVLSNYYKQILSY